MRRLLWLPLAIGLALGCGDGDGSDDDAGTGGMDAATADAGGGGADAGDTDAGDTDAGGSTDAGDTDAGDTDAGDTDAGFDAGLDAGDVDAGPACGGMTVGSCAEPGLTCQCCPAGGPLNNCLCTEPARCMDDDDCTDPARPRCNRPMIGGGPSTGICTPTEFGCAWGAVCAAPDTLIATPTGERAIAELEVGDLIFTRHGGQLVARPLIRVTRTPVVDHFVVRAVLDSGATLRISGPHPTADGRTFADLAPGDSIDGTQVVEVETIPYPFAYTHDILADSDSGTYVAGGVLIGSTLTR